MRLHLSSNRLFSDQNRCTELRRGAPRPRSGPKLGPKQRYSGPRIAARRIRPLNWGLHAYKFGGSIMPEWDRESPASRLGVGSGRTPFCWLLVHLTEPLFVCEHGSCRSIQRACGYPRKRELTGTKCARKREPLSLPALCNSLREGCCIRDAEIVNPRT